MAGRSAYFVTSDGYIHEADAATGTERWQARANRTTPAVADGILYYVWKSVLYAVDVKTKQPRWQFPAGQYVDIKSSPAVVQGAIYFGSDDGYLYALDAATGRLRWKVKADDDVTSAPAVGDGIVYFTAATNIRQAPDYIVPENHLYAVDTASGHLLWRFQGDGEAFAPVVANGVVYCISRASTAEPLATTGPASGSVYALDARTGRPLWRYSPNDGLDDVVRPVVADGMLYIPSVGHALHAVDLQTHQERWSFKAGDSVYGTAIAGQTIYFDDGTLLDAVDTQTGRALGRSRRTAA